MTTLDLSKDILSLTEFKRKTAECVEQMKETGRPMVLTVNGKAQLVVLDAEAYQQWAADADYAQALAGIRRGLEDVKRGRTMSVQQFSDRLRKRFKLPKRKIG
jgi:prevent-host-death family protein